MCLILVAIFVAYHLHLINISFSSDRIGNVPKFMWQRWMNGSRARHASGKTNARGSGSIRAPSKSKVLVGGKQLPTEWNGIKARQLRGYSRANKTTDVWFGFHGLKARQDVRSGDTYALDYSMLGFSAMSRHQKRFNVLVQCNGTDFQWDGDISLPTVLGTQATFTVDLPLGRHQLRAAVYVQGFQKEAVWSEIYTLTVRRVRKPQEGENATGSWLAASEKLPDDWDSPPAGNCAVSLLCRVMRDWAEAAHGAGIDDYFLTSYTLLGARLWGWHMPWRGNHRWDRGASNPHERFKMHYTPWKDRIYLGLAHELYTPTVEKQLEKALYSQREFLKPRWKVSKSGDAAKGVVRNFQHALGGSAVVLYLFHEGGKPARVRGRDQDASSGSSGIFYSLSQLLSSSAQQAAAGNAQAQAVQPSQLPATPPDRASGERNASWLDRAMFAIFGRAGSAVPGTVAVAEAGRRQGLLGGGKQGQGPEPPPGALRSEREKEYQEWRAARQEREGKGAKGPGAWQQAGDAAKQEARIKQDAQPRQAAMLPPRTKPHFQSFGGKGRKEGAQDRHGADLGGNRNSSATRSSAARTVSEPRRGDHEGGMRRSGGSNGNLSHVNLGKLSRRLGARRLLAGDGVAMQGKRGARWRGSTLESEAGAIVHSSIDLLSTATLGGTFNVPRNVDEHLLEAFGHGYENLYAANKWPEDHIAPPTRPSLVEQARQARAVPDRDLALSDLVIEGFGRVQEVCWSLPPAQDAGWELPRFDGQSIPLVRGKPARIQDMFSVYLCSKGKMQAVKPLSSGALKPGDTSGTVKLVDATGALVVVRKQGCVEHLGGFINPGKRLDEVWELARGVFGPDEFIADLVGPELLALTQQHMGRCVYIFPFEVSLAGRYQLTLKLTRSNYTALDEVNFASSHPTMHFDDVLGSGSWVDFERGPALGKSVKALIEGEGQPWCAPRRNGEMRGRWVSRFGDDSSLWLGISKSACPKARKGVRHPSYRAGGSGRRWKVDFSQYSWAPYACKERFFRPAEASECLAKRSFLFTGDSHMRTFFNSVVKYSCGVPDAAQKGHHTSQCHHGSDLCGGAVFCLEHNMLGLLPPCSLFAPSLSLLICCYAALPMPMAPEHRNAFYEYVWFASCSGVVQQLVVQVKRRQDDASVAHTPLVVVQVGWMRSTFRLGGT